MERLAQRRGNNGGTDRPYAPEEEQEIVRAWQEGETCASIGARLGRDRANVYAMVNRLLVRPPAPQQKVRACIGWVWRDHGAYREKCGRPVRSPGGVSWMCYDCKARG